MITNKQIDCTVHTDISDGQASQNLQKTDSKNRLVAFYKLLTF